MTNIRYLISCLLVADLLPSIAPSLKIFVFQNLIIKKNNIFAVGALLSFHFFFSLLCIGET